MREGPHDADLQAAPTCTEQVRSGCSGGAENRAERTRSGQEVGDSDGAGESNRAAL